MPEIDWELLRATAHEAATHAYVPYSKFRVEPGKKYFVNVGSIGQPRDGNPKAAYVIYDMAQQTIELRRLDYDIPTAQRKIREAGLPERLAQRLALGR